MKIAHGVKIAIDLMGGEEPPQVVLEAAREAVLGSSDVCVCIADEQTLSALKNDSPSVKLVPAENFIAMDESPLYAVRRKKNSSMAVGLRLLKEGSVDAFFTTGNTGALVANAQIILPKFSGVDRPALLVLLPTEKGRVVVLDVGANVAIDPSHFVSYARLGQAFARLAFGTPMPRVGLLNIGEEDLKGSQVAKEAFSLLTSDLGEAFFGNIEGRDVFHGKVDVLVTDGFTGNVFLKTCEGASAFLLDYLQERVKGHIFPFLKELQAQFNYAKYPGAILCGVRGLVVKCHGYSSHEALQTGIRGALELSRKGFIEHFSKINF